MKFFNLSVTHKYIFGVCAICFFVYANIVQNTFVWDDKGFIYAAPFAHPLYTFRWLFTADGQAVYRPLFYLYQNIISIISQGNPTIIHLIQLGLHSANAVLLFFLFKKFIREPVALFLALVFAIHPINVEAVSYMAAGSNTVLFLLGILAIGILNEKRESIKKYFSAGVLLLLALLTNEAGISWICIAIASLWISKKLNRKNVLAMLTPVVVVYGFLRLFISQSAFHKFGYIPIATLPFAGRLMTMPKIFAYYVTTFFYPADLSIAQHWTVKTFSLSGFWIPFLFDLFFVSASIIGGIYLYRKHKKFFKPYLFFAVWFVFGIAPYLQLVPVDMTVADRWFYLPVAGLLGMIGVLVQTIKFPPIHKTAGLVLAGIILFTIGLRTYVRNGDWRDGITLYTHDLKINPESFDLHTKLAGELIAIGKFDEARPHALKAVALQPDDISSLGNLALIYLHENNIEKAREYLQKLLVQDPANKTALNLLNYLNATRQ